MKAKTKTNWLLAVIGCLILSFALCVVTLITSSQLACICRERNGAYARFYGRECSDAYAQSRV